MIEEMIADMNSSFRKGVFTNRTSFLFLISDNKVTVTLDADSFSVGQGAAKEKIDCTCTIGAEMFQKIWFEGYRPGFMEFLNGTIKADQPLLLPQFLKAFGKA